MKLTIIGGGNMGSAIAKGLTKSQNDNLKVALSDPSFAKNKPDLDASVEIFSNNLLALNGADAVLFAVKPWVLPIVAEELKGCDLPDIIISIVAGNGTERLSDLFGEDKQIFYVIPNTAIINGKGMSFITPRNASQENIELIKSLFAQLGEATVIEERLMGAATALSSCGIAYAYKYIQACVQAGVQLGFKPEEAQRYAVATVEGAMSMLHSNETSPQKEIDRVTTPGGMTIRGINKLEETGFVSSVIQSIIEPLK